VAFTSSVPGIYEALLALIRKTASEQSPEPSVFEFELAQWEPGAYVIVGPIRGPRYDWHAFPLQLEEEYEIQGKATVFSGDSPATNQTVAAEILTQTFELVSSCVMEPAIANRDSPTFGTSGPSAQVMFPVSASYSSGVEVIGGQPGGWGGVIDWALTFKAIITPSPQLSADFSVPYPDESELPEE
jgi:hypothetical protein